mmetsp:Transcript_15248/g.51716  ORF Transcript_15248/g.51716 Transcript_15248/m.51716 type:complete len:222 (-) Transcript_15248:843-1508(-)
MRSARPTRPSQPSVSARRRSCAPTSGPLMVPVSARRSGWKRRLPLRPSAFPVALTHAFHSAACSSPAPAGSSPASYAASTACATSAKPSSSSSAASPPASVSSRGKPSTSRTTSAASFTTSMLPLAMAAAAAATSPAAPASSSSASAPGGSRPSASRRAPTRRARCSSGSARRCCELTHRSLAVSNTAGLFTTRSSEKRFTSSSVSKISSSVPSFHPSSAR